MRAAVALLVVLFAAAPADAQFRRDKRFAERGDVALVVGVGGIQVTQLQPVLNGVGLRVRLADQTVLGASVGVSVSEVDDESDRSGGSDQGYATERESQAVDVSLWLEQHLGRPNRRVSPFVGAGLTAGTGRSESATRTVDVVPCDPDVDRPCGEVRRESASVVDRRSIAGGLVAGAEVRLARGVTLGGAYALGVTVYESDRSGTETRDVFGDVDVQAFESEGGGYSFGTRASQLYLSVYF